MFIFKIQLLVSVALDIYSPSERLLGELNSEFFVSNLRKKKSKSIFSSGCENLQLPVVASIRNDCRLEKGNTYIIAKDKYKCTETFKGTYSNHKKF